MASEYVCRALLDVTCLLRKYCSYSCVAALLRLRENVKRHTDKDTTAYSNMGVRGSFGMVCFCMDDVFLGRKVVSCDGRRIEIVSERAVFLQRRTPP